MSKKPHYTPEQQIVIDKHGSNMLVSASAGAGKTTVMIERIVKQLQSVDVSDMVIVTFTNAAAEEMKARLIKKLSKNTVDDKGNVNSRLIKQLEKIDSANISTLHSFCGDLLRNYFYAVDLDPAFAIFDEATANTLKNNAMEDLIAEYLQQDDEDFKKVYKIFATNRKEENFTKLILRLYSFSRCLVDFKGWYGEKKQNFAHAVAKTLLDDVARTVRFYYEALLELVVESGNIDKPAIQLALESNAELLKCIDLTDFENAVYGLVRCSFVEMPRRRQPVPEEEEAIRVKYEALKKKLDGTKGKYKKLLRVADGVTLTDLWQENAHMVAYTDKLVELTCRFDEIYADYKRQRGGVDYDDLEHFALKLLTDDDAIRDEIHSRYKLIFVDEYQDTNPIQEAIIQALTTNKDPLTGEVSLRHNLFMVGDVKQSIYGFRGCDPSNFTKKQGVYQDYGISNPKDGWLVTLNDNFRSNCDVLDFVNEVFNVIMTNDFGNVDYVGSAQLKGNKTLVTPEISTRVDIITKEKYAKQSASGLYDITVKPDADSVLTQGEVIARRIKEYVGKTFIIEAPDEDGKMKRTPYTIDYDDVIILMRGMQDKALDIYNTLRNYSIPVTAKFKVDALQNKEIKDLINLFRVVDNPYVDVSMVGACLSVFGGMTEAELGHVRLHSQDGLPFYTRLQKYAENGEKRDLGSKIAAFLDLIDNVRFFSRSAGVDEVALFVIAETNYGLHVQGLPNGELRLKKLYAFIDSLKGLNYAQSIDKFLSYIDDVDDHRAEEALSATGTVRMMTMHASKGLEAPIVFVAGLESKFVFDYLDVEQNNELGLATRFYDFGEMSRAETLGFHALRLANERKQREEEMRLLYVAMTRAQYLLNLVVTRNEDDEKKDDAYDYDEDGNDCSYLMIDKVRRHSDWILPIVYELQKSGKVARLDVQDPPIFSNGDTYKQMSTEAVANEKNVAKNGNGGEKSDLNSEKTQHIVPQLSKREQAEVDAILAEFNVPYEYQAETVMSTKVVSSALGAEYFKRWNDESQTAEEAQPTEVNLEPKSDSNLVGTAYHKLYENIFRDAANRQKADGIPIEQILESVTVEQIKNKIQQLHYDGIEQEYADRINPELVYATLHGRDFLNLFKDGSLYPEKPFMLSIPYEQLDENKTYRDNVILQGVIDLLIVKSANVDGVDKPISAVVVDFKYTAHKDAIVDKYRLQLKSYKLAVAKILGITNVSAYVLSIRDNELIEM